MIYYVLKMTPIVVVFSFFSFSFLRTQFFSKQKRKSNRKRERLLLAFSTYCLWLLFFLLIDNERLEMGGVLLGIDTTLTDWKLNLMPFATIKAFWRYGTFTGMFLNIFGNVLAFMPFGFFLPVIWERTRHWYITVILSFAMSLIVETMQLVGKVGSFDVDDLLLNTIGGFVGYIIFALAKGVWERYSGTNRK